MIELYSVLPDVVNFKTVKKIIVPHYVTTVRTLTTVASALVIERQSEIMDLAIDKLIVVTAWADIHSLATNGIDIKIFSGTANIHVNESVKTPCSNTEHSVTCIKTNPVKNNI